VCNGLFGLCGLEAYDEVSANSATPIPRRDEKSDGSQDALLEDSSQLKP